MVDKPQSDHHPGLQFEKLKDLVSRLRHPEKGCPWDLAQDETTVKPFVIEEAYEVLEALESGDRERICEELGDLLFQVLFLSRIFEEKSDFSIVDILTRTYNKMKNRHPHIFGSTDVKTVDDVLQNWEKLKKREKRKKDKASILSGLPASLPALLTADQITRRAARVGFDWENVSDIFDKLDEEILELKKAMEKDDKESCRNEVGDVLFTLVNLARRQELNAEDALRGTNRKFVARFEYIEKTLKKTGKTLFEASLEDMDRLWNEAKEAEKQA